MKMTISLLSAVVLTAALMTGCGQKTAIHKEEQLIVHTKGEMLSEPSSMTEGDPVTIDTAWIQGKELVAKVSYSGGCADHEFKLIGDNKIMKSLPPQRVIWIHHNANGDACRGWVSKTLRFDISDLVMQGEKPDIIFRLKGFQGRLAYPAAK